MQYFLEQYHYETVSMRNVATPIMKYSIDYACGLWHLSVLILFKIFLDHYLFGSKSNCHIIVPSMYVTISETDFHQPSVSILGYKPHLYEYVYIGSRINFHINFNAYIRLYLWFEWSRRLRRRSRHWSQSPNPQPKNIPGSISIFELLVFLTFFFFLHFQCL